MRRRRILFAGGGTGGHIYPALALAGDLEKEGWGCLFLGTRRPSEMRIFERSPFPHVGLPVSSAGRGGAALVDFARRMVSSLATAQNLVKRFRPDVCVGLGGYGSIPGVLCSAMRKVPVALFEPNSIPGRANRVLEMVASEIWTWFPSASAGFRSRRKVYRTGIPLRADLRNPARRADARGPGRVLVIGGSQGADGLNGLVGRMLPAMKYFAPGIRFSHISGPGNEQSVSAMYASAGIEARVAGYAHDMAEWYSEADAVMCRCGAGTLAELTAMGLPSVLVPHPSSPDRHQHLNARYLSSAGAAIVVDEQSADPVEASKALGLMMGDPGFLARMSAASKSVSSPDAHRKILKRVGILAERV